MIKNFIEWFFSINEKPIVEDIDLYAKIVELEERIAKLEDENIESTNLIYELSNTIEAVDARIDILTLEKWSKDNV